MRVCSLFAGAGGIDLGFEQAGYSVVWANEIDRNACITYRKNFPKTKLVQKDIRQINAENIPNFDLLAAGFPCQPFSIAGPQEGFAHAEGTLFFDICRILQTKKPAVVFLENVANLVNHDGGKTLKIILSDLQQLGYHIKYAILNAKDYGVPQSRKRIYIVGFLNAKTCQAFDFPPKTKLTQSTATIIDRTQKVDDSYYLEKSSWQWEAMNNEIKEDGQICAFFNDSIRSSHNGICFTLLAHMGYWPDRIPIIKDDFGIRLITPKECFSIQGFPDSFDLSATPAKSAYMQAGNSVCVPVIKMIADEIKHAVVKGNKHLTYVGGVKSETQLEACISNLFYHLPRRMLREEDAEKVQAIALYLPKRIFSVGGIKYIGKVTGYQIVKRSDITELPKQSNELYYRFQISEWDAKNDICIDNYTGYGIYNLAQKTYD